MAPPRKPDARRDVLHLRVNSKEVARWKRAAKRAEVSLQELVRSGASLKAENILLPEAAPTKTAAPVSQGGGVVKRG